MSQDSDSSQHLTPDVAKRAEDLLRRAFTEGEAISYFGVPGYGVLCMRGTEPYSVQWTEINETEQKEEFVGVLWKDIPAEDQQKILAAFKAEMERPRRSFSVSYVDTETNTISFGKEK